MPLLTIDPSVLTQAERQDFTRAYGLHLQTKDAQGAPRDATVAEIKAELIRHAQWVVSTNLTEDDRAKVPVRTVNLDK